MVARASMTRPACTTPVVTAANTPTSTNVSSAPVRRSVTRVMPAASCAASGVTTAVTAVTTATNVAKETPPTARQAALGSSTTRRAARSAAGVQAARTPMRPISPMSHGPVTLTVAMPTPITATIEPNSTVAPRSLRAPTAIAALTAPTAVSARAHRSAGGVTRWATPSGVIATRRSPASAASSTITRTTPAATAVPPVPSHNSPGAKARSWNRTCAASGTRAR